MNKLTFSILGCLFLLASWPATGQSAGKQVLIETHNTTLIFTVGANQRLYQSYLGPRIGDRRENLAPGRLTPVTSNIFELTEE